jgi:hypothetical protein
MLLSTPEKDDAYQSGGQAYHDAGPQSDSSDTQYAQQDQDDGNGKTHIADQTAILHGDYSFGFFNCSEHLNCAE